MGKKDSIHSTALQNTKPNSDNDAYPIKIEERNVVVVDKKGKEAIQFANYQKNLCQSALAWNDRDNNNPRGQQVTEKCKQRHLIHSSLGYANSRQRRHL